MTKSFIGGRNGPLGTWNFFRPYLVGLFFLICFAAQAQQSVTLGWNPEADPSVTGYVLYYGTSSQQYSIREDVGTNTAVTVSALALGTNYFFAVTSYNGANIESVPSPEVSISVQASRFFTGQTAVDIISVVPNSTDTTTEYLQFPNGNVFGYYTMVAFPWFYHHDMGYEYFFEANDGMEGIFLYDLNSDTFWYTSPEIFPIMYDFTQQDWLYYYPDKNNPGHYTSSPRYFYDYVTKKIISK